jgi:hypothetical protein
VSKPTTTHGYIDAWFVYVITLVATFLALNNSPSSSSFPPIAIFFYVVLGAAVIVMLVFWIGALVRLGQVHAWGWFAAVPLPHLIGLGIVGMLAYALAGPDDSTVVVIRPPMAT